MLKHKTIVILFGLLFMAMVLSDRRWGVPLALYFLLAFLFISIEFYGAYFIHSNFHLDTLCSGRSAEKVVALTFDDGPLPQTEKVLSVLKEFDIKATFFCIGHRIPGNEQTLKKLFESGHTIGNHSNAHSPLFDLKRTKALKSDLELANRRIKAVIGRTPRFFRPPYGVTTPALARAVRALQYQAIGWNIRSLDTTIKDHEKVLQRIEGRLKPGAIILLHDVVAGSDELLRKLILRLHARHYQIVDIETLIKQPAYAQA